MRRRAGRLSATRRAIRPLPEGAEPLSAFVRGPLELSRRLAQIGVVASREDGDRLKERLSPGQRLVTKEGDLWRWDGFVSDRQCAERRGPPSRRA